MAERANEVTELKRRLAQALREKEQMQEVCKLGVIHHTGCAAHPPVLGEPTCVLNLFPLNVNIISIVSVITKKLNDRSLLLGPKKVSLS